MNNEAKIKDQYFRTLANNKELASQVACVAKQLDGDSGVFLKGFLKYDTDVGTYGNKIYADVAVKAGMYFKYFIEESYQFERQAILSEMVRSCTDIETLVDIGFAVPGKYVLETLKNRPEIHMTLLDKFESSITFSETLLSCATVNWKDQIKLGTYDMDSDVSPGAFDAYIFFDSIEHTKNPDAFLDTILASASEDSYFIFSLPIEKVEVSGGAKGDPMHFVEFLTEDEIRKWLEKHNLKILEERIAKPKSGDFWLAIGESFQNLILKTQKL